MPNTLVFHGARWGVSFGVGMGASFRGPLTLRCEVVALHWLYDVLSSVLPAIGRTLLITFAVCLHAVCITLVSAHPTQHVLSRALLNPRCLCLSHGLLRRTPFRRVACVRPLFVARLAVVGSGRARWDPVNDPVGAQSEPVRDPVKTQSGPSRSISRTPTGPDRVPTESRPRSDRVPTGSRPGPDQIPTGPHLIHHGSWSTRLEI